MGLLLCGGAVDATTGDMAAAQEGRRLSLEEAVLIALAQNPDVAEAESRLMESAARLQGARAAAWPTLSAYGTYDERNTDQRLLQATRNGEQGAFGPRVFGAEIVARLPLYTGGLVSRNVEAAQWIRDATADQATRVRESLVFQVAFLYYELLAQEEVLRSLESAVRAMDEQQRTIGELVDAEKAAHVDLLRANVRRAELYEQQLRERSNRTVQQRAWAALLGLDDVAAPVAEGTLALMNVPVCPAPAECMRTALAQRTDYRAGQSAVFAAEAAVESARAGHRPTIAAQAAYGERWMPDASDLPPETDDREDVLRVGLVVELPLFDGRLTSSRVAEQTARLHAAEARLRKLALQIRFEVETALSDIAAARERVQTAEQAVAQAWESFRIMKEKYDLGSGTLTDLLDAQTALVSTQTRHARALADLTVAAARRQLAVGEILP
jgi:outer membrane protein TolC